MADLRIAIDARGARAGADEFSRQAKRVESGAKGVGTSARAASAGVIRFGRSTADAGRHAATSAISFGRVAVGIAAAIGAARGVQAIGNLAQGIDKIGKDSQRLSVTTQSLQELSFAAGLADIEASALATSMAQFSRNVAQAHAGSETKADALRVLGLEMRDVTGSTLNMTEILAKVADGFASSGSAVERTSALMEIFGRQGAALGPLLSQGAKGVQAAADEAGKLGLVLSDQQIARAAQFNDALHRLSSTVRGIGAEVFASLAPTLTSALDSLRSFFAENRETIVSFLTLAGSVFTFFTRLTFANVNLLVQGFKVAKSSILVFGEAVAIGLQSAALAIREAVGGLSVGQLIDGVNHISARMSDLRRAESELESSTDALSAAFARYGKLLDSTPTDDVLKNFRELDERTKALTTSQDVLGRHAEESTRAQQQGIEDLIQKQTQYANIVVGGFINAARGAQTYQDALRGIGDQIADLIIQEQILQFIRGINTPAAGSAGASVGGGIGGAIADSHTARGNLFGADLQIQNFARGGLPQIIDRPTSRVVGGQLQQFGENTRPGGEEFVLPARRTARGELGVAAIAPPGGSRAAESQGPSGGPVTMNFYGVKDFDSFRRNRLQAKRLANDSLR